LGSEGVDRHSASVGALTHVHLLTALEKRWSRREQYTGMRWKPSTGSATIALLTRKEYCAPCGCAREAMAFSASLRSGDANVADVSKAQANAICRRRVALINCAKKRYAIGGRRKQPRLVKQRNMSCLDDRGTRECLKLETTPKQRTLGWGSVSCALAPLITLPPPPRSSSAHRSTSHRTTFFLN
jgi:hypothetical protein